MDASRSRGDAAGGDWGADRRHHRRTLASAQLARSRLLIGSQESGKMPLPRSRAAMVYQSILPRACRPLSTTGRDFPNDLADRLARKKKWNFDDATFDRSAAAFDNPTCRHLWSITPLAARLAEGEPKYADWTGRLAVAPVITVRPSRWRAMPTVRRTRSRVPTPRCSGNYSHRTSRAARHIAPRKAPQALAEAVIEIAES